MAFFTVCALNLMTNYLPKAKTPWQECSVISMTEAENRYLGWQIVRVLRLWHTRVVELLIFLFLLSPTRKKQMTKCHSMRRIESSRLRNVPYIVLSQIGAHAHTLNSYVLLKNAQSSEANLHGFNLLF